jgi:hypothetical protein
MTVISTLSSPSFVSLPDGAIHAARPAGTTSAVLKGHRDGRIALPTTFRLSVSSIMIGISTFISCLLLMVYVEGSLVLGIPGVKEYNSPGDWLPPRRVPVPFCLEA